MCPPFASVGVSNNTPTPAHCWVSPFSWDVVESIVCVVQVFHRLCADYWPFCFRALISQVW